MTFKCVEKMYQFFYIIESYYKEILKGEGKRGVQRGEIFLI